ncbi:unnamed protein product [Pedinophyceae sp. YPF-701]|nr:unnamed protein product [Pedinophyceae sp. YPF-701]
MAAQGPSDGPNSCSPHTGTTILAIVYDGGVVLAADSRVSMGSYVSNRASNKIAPLGERVFLCRSGSAADTQAVGDYVAHFLNQHAMELGSEPKVRTAANLVKEMNYNNQHLMAAMIIAGYDDLRGGQVYGIPIGGTLVPQNWAVDGSGSTYIWGLCDAEYREGMTRDEAETFAISAVSAAMARDGSSGGLLRLVTINKEGVHKRTVLGSEIPLYHEELPIPAAA